MNKTVLLASVAAVLLAAPAFAEDVEHKSTFKSETTDAAGTTVTTEKKVKSEVDEKGNVKEKVTTEQKTDPKGLMNSTKVETKDTVKSEDGKTVTTHEKEVNGDTVEKTKTESHQ